MVGMHGVGVQELLIIRVVVAVAVRGFNAHCDGGIAVVGAGVVVGLGVMEVDEAIKDMGVKGGYGCRCPGSGRNTKICGR